MTEGKRKSRSKRRAFVRTPKGVSKIVYIARNPKQAHCGECGAVLKGTPRISVARMKNLAKTKKRPTRPYGGVLCSSCMRKRMIQKARGLKYD